MSLEEQKRLARLYFQAYDASDNSFLEKIVAPDFDFHAVHGRYGTVIIPSGEGLRGPAMVRAFIAERGAVWHDAMLTLDELVAEGDRVTILWTFRGIHVGTFLGIAPTQRRVTYSGLHIFRVAHGKLAEAWELMDRLSLFQQLGVLPATREILAGRAMPSDGPAIG